MSRKKVTIYPPGDGIWLSFQGSPSRIIATGDQTGGSLAVTVGVSPPDGSAPPHSHGFDEGFWILRGSMEFTAGNKSVTLGEGGFINIRGGTAHYPTNRSGAQAELITFIVPAGFEAFQIAVGERVDGADGPFPETPEDILEKMLAEGPRFGIDLSPDPSEFERGPEITVREPGAGAQIGVAGDVYRFLVSSADTDGRYALWHAKVFPGGGPPPHTHSKEEEFFYVLSGEVTIYDDGTAHRGTPGTAVVLPRGTRHWFKNEGDRPAEMLIGVAPAGLEEMFRFTGRGWTGADVAPGAPSPEEIEKLKAIAPEYGIEIG